MIFAVLSLFCFASYEVTCRYANQTETKNSGHRALVACAVPYTIFYIVATCFKLQTPGLHAIPAIIEDPALCLTQVLYAFCLLFGALSYRRIPVTIGAPISSSASLFAFIGIYILQKITHTQELEQDLFTYIKIVLSIITIVCVIVFSRKYALLEDAKNNKKIENYYTNKNKGLLVIVGVVLALLSAFFDGAAEVADVYIISDYSIIDYFYCQALVFAIIGIIAYIICCISEKTIYNPFARKHLPKLYSGTIDCAGCLFLLYALENDALFSSVLISTYYVFAVLGGRIVLKESIDKSLKGLIATIVFTTLLLAIL